MYNQVIGRICLRDKILLDTLEVWLAATARSGKISPVRVILVSDKWCHVIINYLWEDIIILGVHMELYYSVSESQNIGNLYNVIDSYFEKKVFIGHI